MPEHDELNKQNLYSPDNHRVLYNQLPAQNGLKLRQEPLLYTDVSLRRSGDQLGYIEQQNKWKRIVKLPILCLHTFSQSP